VLDETASQFDTLLQELLDKEKRNFQHDLGLHFQHPEPLLQRKFLRNTPQGLDICLLAFSAFAVALDEEIDIVV
jgi:hypothetical protein